MSTLETLNDYPLTAPETTRKQVLIEIIRKQLCDEADHIQRKIDTDRAEALEPGTDLHRIAFNINLCEKAIEGLAEDNKTLENKTLEELELLYIQMKNKLDANEREKQVIPPSSNLAEAEPRVRQIVEEIDSVSIDDIQQRHPYKLLALGAKSITSSK